MRVGNGYDVHPLVEGRPLVIGGVDIDWPMGLAGHSDADVLLHVICDACLGAMAKGDIGQHFPPSKVEYKNVDSRQFVRRTREIMVEEKWQVLNLDCIIVAEKPRLSPYIPAMRRHIASDLGIALNQVSVKATTTERLGFCGREEGIAAYCVVLLQSTMRKTAET